jgi:hypothetical protein
MLKRDVCKACPKYRETTLFSGMTGVDEVWWCIESEKSQAMVDHRATSPEHCEFKEDHLQER